MLRSALMGLLLLTSILVAEVTSGPKVGDRLEDFKVFGVVGILDQKEGSYIAERKDEVTVYAFVQAEHFSRPMARFLKTLDGKIQETNDKAITAAIWLTDNVDKSKEYLPRVNMSLAFSRTSLGVFPGEKSGPNLWGINNDAHLTVVVAHKGKATAVFAYHSVNETDADKILAEIKKLK